MAPHPLHRRTVALLLVSAALGCAGARSRAPRPPHYAGVLEFDYHPPVTFYPCGLDSTRWRERWAVRWDSAAHADLQRALRQQAKRSWPTSRDRFFVTLVGIVSDTGHFGYMGGDAREVRVARVPRVELLQSRNGDIPSAATERDIRCR